MVEVKILAGDKSPQSKLTVDDVREIRERIANGETTREVAAVFGMSKSRVSQIARREAWSHVD